MTIQLRFGSALLLMIFWLAPVSGRAQTAPSSTEVAQYAGLHAAAYAGDIKEVTRLVDGGASLEARDTMARTPLHVAAFQSHDDVVKALVAAGADINAREHADYDVVTIAAVADDLAMMKLALSLGGNAKNITSPYEGTALIAAAHLGHVEVVDALIKAGAPLDHVNNLGWTALIEAVVLGDGGPRHTEIVGLLISAGADMSIADRQGVTPLALAKRRGFDDMVATFPASAK